MKYLKFFLYAFFIFLQTNLNADISYIDKLHELDHRKVKNKSSPMFLDSVGSLGYINSQISKLKNINIECSGILVSSQKNNNGNKILTSEHCLSDEHIETYTWLSQTKNKRIFRKGKVIYRDKVNDLAIIKLKKSINYNDIKPLIFKPNIKIKRKNYLVAGYSIDFLGNYGKLLTYDKPDYVHWGIESGIGKIGSITYQGDSGGAVIFNDTETNTQYIVWLISFIRKTNTVFLNEKNKYGNISGYFTDLINYQPSIQSLKDYFYKI